MRREIRATNLPLAQTDDLSWFKPFEPSDDTIGSFSGDHESLNIANAQPDMRYYYARNKPDAIIRFLNKGWTVVGPDDPERYGTGRVSWKAQVPLGTDLTSAYGDVILMKIPMHLYAEQQAAKDEYNQSVVSDFGARFVERGEERAQQLSARSRPREQLYYVGREHGQFIEEF